MNKKTTRVIGLMSGTSLDGLDLVCVDFHQSDTLDYQIIASDTFSYSDDWQQKLKTAFHFNATEIEQIHLEYGRYLGDQVNRFIRTFDVSNVDFVASHGHTIFHKPDEGYTLQIGNGQSVANLTNLQVICDFRTQDVEMGGQGAPLVPIGDRLLFSEYSHCINLGGFANVSFDNSDGNRIAFDICPVNVILNQYADQLGFDYDENGHLASKGEFNLELFDTLNAIDFYSQTPPKSLGMEWVATYMNPILKSFALDAKSVLRTYVEHIAVQIATVVSSERSSILLTGGGAKNKFLVKRLEALTSSKIVIPSNEIIDYKEALIFALLGLLRSQNQVNCLRSVTGAKKDHSSGLIFTPEAV